MSNIHFYAYEDTENDNMTRDGRNQSYVKGLSRNTQPFLLTKLISISILKVTLGVIWKFHRK